MSDINVFTVIGRLTRDCETTMTPKGTALTKFSIANNTGYGDYKKTNYFDIDVWGKVAESISKYLLKGKKVCINGTLNIDTYEKEGIKMKHVCLTARDVCLLDAAKDVDGRSEFKKALEGIDADDEAFKAKYARTTPKQEEIPF